MRLCQSTDVLRIFHSGLQLQSEGARPNIEIMSQLARLAPGELDSALSELPDWSVIDGKLHREYRFADFAHAFGFMAAAATAIEKMDHHPEWFNVYGRVVVDLWTHSAGGLTVRDLKLARKLEEFAQKLLG